MVSIGQIEWPKSLVETENLYLSFAVKIVEPLNLNFPFRCNPVHLLKAYLAGDASYSECVQFKEEIWAYLEGRGEVRNPSSQESVNARIALSLLPDIEGGDYSDRLDWLFQFLEMSGNDISYAIEIMQKHFDFGPPTI